LNGFVSADITGAKQRQLLAAHLQYDRPVLAFPFGRGCGFGAEWVGVLKAIIRALHHGMGLRLFALRPGLGVHVRRGWEEYFALPIITLGGRWPGIAWTVHQRISHVLPAWTVRSVDSVLLRRARFLPIGTPSTAGDGCIEMGFTGDWWHDAQIVAKCCWSFSNAASSIIREVLARQALPSQYVAVHIRRGDKGSERPEPGDDQYLSTIAALDTALPVVLLGDDRVYLERFAKRELRGRDTLVLSGSTGGFVESEFNKLAAGLRFRRNCEFLADVEVMRRAEFVVGDGRSNVFFMTQYLRAGKGMVGLERQ
jgi:hypothetical protein